MTRNPIGWFEIYVIDMDRAKSFYEQVFALKFTKLNSGDLNMWAFPGDAATGTGATGALVQMPGLTPGGVSTLVYFSCEDCAVEESRVVPAGGRIHRPKLSIGEYGFITLAYDTEVNLIGMHSMK